MDGELRKKKNTWSTILTRPKRQNRKQLEEAGYRRIATTGKHTRRVDVHLKLGHGGKIGEQEVLVRLEALRNFGKIGFNEVDSQAFITMTAENPWKAGETEQLRRKLITEAMRWIETPTAAKGVMTEEQIQYMVDRGITRKTAAKIVRETTEELFEEYVQDEYSKKNYCKKKIEQAAREKEKQWKEKLRKEKEQQKETKEQEKNKGDKEKRRKKEDKQKEKQLENEQRKEKRRNQENIKKTREKETERRNKVHTEEQKQNLKNKLKEKYRILQEEKDAESREKDRKAQKRDEDREKRRRHREEKNRQKEIIVKQGKRRDG
jgi:hypothetical protein